MQKHIESLEKQLDQKQKSIDTALSSILQMNMISKLQADKLHKTVDSCDINKGEVKDNIDPQHQRRKRIAVIGDSMLNNITSKGLSAKHDVTVHGKSGDTIEKNVQKKLKRYCHL